MRERVRPMTLQNMLATATRYHRLGAHLGPRRGQADDIAARHGKVSCDGLAIAHDPAAE